jgi:HSP20 family protein
MPHRPRRYAGTLVSAQLKGELERLFQEVLAARESAARAGWSPAVDVLEVPENVVVLVEVPGLGPEDLRVEVADHTLHVKGRRRLAFGAPGRVRFHCLERQEGGFARAIEVPGPVDFRRARASLADGLLRIELPKVEERRRRTFALTIEERAEPQAGVSDPDAPGTPESPDASQASDASNPTQEAPDEP